MQIFLGRNVAKREKANSYSQIRSVTRRTAIIATAIREDDAIEPLEKFVGHPEAYTWRLPNRLCFEAMVRSAGFDEIDWISAFRLDYRNGEVGLPHGVIHARVATEIPIETKKDKIPIGFVDVPSAEETSLSDSLAFIGWALDDVEVGAVILGRDPVETDRRQDIGYD